MPKFKKYAVLICPICKHYTYSSINIKNRICPYCGKIIDARKHIIKILDTAKDASLVVRTLNLKNRKTKAISDIEIGFSISPSKKASRTEDIKNFKQLIFLLRTHAKTMPISIDAFLDICVEDGLDASWVKERLERLANEGLLVYPRPWELQYFQDSENSTNERNKKLKYSKLYTRIVSILRKNKNGLTLEKIYKLLDDTSISIVELEKALKRLLDEGELFSPKNNFYKIVSDA